MVPHSLFYANWFTGKGKETNVTSAYISLSKLFFGGFWSGFFWGSFFACLFALFCFLSLHDIMWDHRRIYSTPRSASSDWHCRASDDCVGVMMFWLHISCKDFDEEI